MHNIPTNTYNYIQLFEGSGSFEEKIIVNELKILNNEN